MDTTPTTGAAVLRRAVTGQWRHVATGATLAAGHQAGEALVPVLIGVVIDEAVSTGATSSLAWWIVALAVIFAGLSYSFRFCARAAERAGEQAAHGLRLGLTARILDPRGGAEKGQLAGGLVSIATGDARRVGEVNSALTFGLAALAGVLVSAVLLLRISVPLGLLVLLGTPPLLLLTHLIGRPLERRSGVEQERAAHASGLAADLVGGVRVLKGIGAESAAVDRYRQVSRYSLASTLRAARAQAWHNGAILALNGAFIAVVALVGGRLAADGDITVGGLVAAVGLAQFLLVPLSTFAWAGGALAQGRASAARVATVLAAAPAVGPGSTAPGGLGPAGGGAPGVRLSGVTHGPLAGLDLDVSPGELLGVVAPDPADATALLECLARDVDPAAGSVELAGVALSTLDPSAVRTAILVADHDADLFEGTLRSNIAGEPAAVDRAMAAAGVDEVASTLPDGVDTAVAERGRSLSGGQRQRVALARALAAEPPVLVLHDPTTAVDAVTEARIATELRSVRDGRTTLLVTTSPALLAATDRVVVLRDGRIDVEGSHPDLARDHESYRAAVLS